MNEQEVMDQLAGTGDAALPMVDARTGRMIGIFANNESL
jgi:hypothetical protein